MLLTTKMRLMFNRLYPGQTTIVGQSLVRDIEEKVGVSSDEMKEISLEFSEDGRMMKWDEEKNIDKEVEFTKAELDLLKGQVAEMDKEQKITQNILELCILVRDYSDKDDLDLEAAVDHSE